MPRKKLQEAPGPRASIGRRIPAPNDAMQLAREAVKFPRIPHLPWSPGRSTDDLALPNTHDLEGEEVVVTEKVDGEGTTMYDHTLHARSVDSRDHPSRHWVKGLHGQIRHRIPKGWRLCGENMYAQHSIAYDRLPSFFLAFMLFDPRGFCRSWDETVRFTSELGLATVPVLYRGRWTERLRTVTWPPALGPETEGYVIRAARHFRADVFDRYVAKYVRAGHVQTDEHWLDQEVVRNGLQGELPFLR